MDKAVIASSFDLCLSLILIFLSWQTLRSRDLFVGIVLFIMFGLFMALAWVQLQAPDIALVEAAIGAGLTGALFLGTLGRIEYSHPLPPQETHPQIVPADTKSKALIFLLTSSIVLLLLTSLGPIIFNQGMLAKMVETNLARSGAENPVTAVILNFRAYDTLLEIGVLLLVAIATYALFGKEGMRSSKHLSRRNLILVVFLRMISPLMIVVSLYLLWAGGHAPGGAFQAGALLGGAGILLLLGGFNIKTQVNRRLWRTALVFGFTGFILTGVYAMVESQVFLDYPVQKASLYILAIEIACTLSIAGIFISLFKLCSGILTEKTSNLNSEKEGASK